MPTYNNFAQTTVVTLYKNCPCDRDYHHTIHFSSLADQTAYFSSLVKLTLTNSDNMQSFQRATINSIRVNVPEWSVREYNYLCFNNGSAMGSKNFYCFVDRTEYINPNTTEVFYTEDVMQTWMFEYVFEDCFIERMHSPTDVAGENVVPEKVDVGPYMLKSNDRDIKPSVTLPGGIAGDYIFVLAASAGVYYTTDSIPQIKYEKADAGHVYQGAPSGVILMPFDTGHIDSPYAYNTDPWKVFPVDPATPNGNSYGRPSFKRSVDELVGKGGIDVILGAYILPKEYTAYIESTTKQSPVTINVNPFATYDPLTSQWVYSDIKAMLRYYWGGSQWTPQNNKIYTYPYAYLSMSNGDGEENSYRLECFTDPSTPSFEFSWCCTPDACVLAVPHNYKGQTRCPNESISMSSFPMLSFNADSFKAWWAQNRVNVIKGIVNTTASVATGVGLTEHANPMPKYRAMSNRSKLRTNEAMVRGTVSEISSVSDAMISAIDASRQANIKIGNSSGTVQYMANLLGMRSCMTYVSPYYAKMIDEYFSMFGYATNRVGKPNITSRPYWNYVKTSNCHIASKVDSTGGQITYTRGIDAETKEKICSIYDEGITFWHYRQDMDVGNYSKDNRPVVTP